MNASNAKLTDLITARNGSAIKDNPPGVPANLRSGLIVEAVADDRSVTALVARARNGDKQAWDELVERYAPLIWSICHRYRLRQADANDVGQSVWLRLLSQFATLRRQAALPRLAGHHHPAGMRPGTERSAETEEPTGHWPDAADIPDKATEVAESELLRAERHAALREAFTHLPPDSRQLIAMLIHDPPVPYAEISARLGIPVGSMDRAAAAAWRSCAGIRQSLP